VRVRDNMGWVQPWVGLGEIGLMSVSISAACATMREGERERERERESSGHTKKRQEAYIY